MNWLTARALAASASARSRCLVTAAACRVAVTANTTVSSSTTVAKLAASRLRWDHLAQLVGGARRARQDRLRGEVAVDVVGERRDAAVAALGVLFEGLDDDRLDVGVELARPAPALAERARRLLADHAHGVGQRGAEEVVGRRPEISS